MLIIATTASNNVVTTIVVKVNDNYKYHCKG